MDERIVTRHDNQPPETIGPDLSEVDAHHLLVVPLERLRELLERKYPHLMKRRDELIAGVLRWIEKHSPAGATEPCVSLDDTDGRDTLDYKRQLESFIGDSGTVLAEKERVKRELLEACRFIERWFVDEVKLPVALQHAVVQRAYTSHLIELERRRTEAAAKQAAESARRAGVLAGTVELLPDGDTKDAVLAQIEELGRSVEEASGRLSGSLAARSRERGFVGTVAGLRSKWSWEWEPDGKTTLIKAVAEGKESADLLDASLMIGKIVINNKLRRPIPGVKMVETKTSS